MDQEALHTVGFSLKLWLVNIAGFLLLLAMLRQWLWTPLKAAVEDRAARIAGQLAEAAQRLQEAQRVRAEADVYVAAKREEAEQQADAIIRQARQRAEEIVADAREEALRLRREAEQAAWQAKLEALNEAKRQAAALGAAMAERLLRDVLDEERQREILAATISDLEELAGNGGGER